MGWIGDISGIPFSDHVALMVYPDNHGTSMPIRRERTLDMSPTRCPEPKFPPPPPPPKKRL